MGDVLSQNEIDNLLSALTTESSIEEITVNDDVNEELDVKEYNFARPPKFNKDHLRTLEIIFDNYSRLLSTFLTGYLRTSVALEVLSSEQITYSEFSNSLSNPIILSVFEMKPLKGSVVFELSASIGYSIIDKILGGPGAALKKLRDFSEIEKILLKRFVTQMLNFLPEPWENVLEIHPVLDKIETNSQFAQIISPNEMVALVTLKIKIGETEGFISFCIPHIVVESVIDRLNTKYWYIKKDDEQEDNYRDSLEESLDDADIEVAAIIGKTNLNLTDIVHLQVGDIIPLDSYLKSDIDLRVEDKIKYKCRPGISKKKNSIQITKILKEGER